MSQSILRCALVLGLAWLWSSGVYGQPLTLVRDDAASASGARAIAVADFNRDGWPDLAQATGNSVTVLLSSHGERLVLASTTPVGSGPFDMATGDFNRDGIPDLAVANADSNSISILIGRGDGRFTRSDISTAPYRSPRGITAGDVNADGIPDLVYSGYGSNLVHVLLGSGAGGFTKGWTFVGLAAKPQGLETADFNRDGHLDAAVAYDSDGGLVILYGNGGTAFTPKAVAGLSDLNVLAVGDLNGDGWLDVAAASTNRGRVAVYLGTATGLDYQRSYWVDSDPRDIAIADLTGDGVPDIITVSRTSSTINVLPGDVAHRGSFLSRLIFSGGNGSRSVASADFNADGRIDLAVGNQYVGAASILTNLTAFTRAGYAFGERILAVAPLAARQGLDAADFNRDGKLDVVTSAGWMFAPDGVMVLITDGPTVVLPVPKDLPLVGFLTGDFNGDGNPDVVYYAREQDGIETPNSQFLTSLGNDRGGFATLPALIAPTEVSKCVAADLDRNGRLDLVCVGSDVSDRAVLRVFDGNGDGTFRVGRRVALLANTEGAYPDPDDLQIADLNRDGSLDVVALNAHGAADFLEVWLGDGTGRLTSGGRVAILMEESFGGMPECLRIGDLNHDGYLDLAVYRGEGQLGVAFGSASGPGSVSEVWRDFEVRYPSQASIGLADIDMDGNLDIITPLGWVLHGRGDGTFEPAERFAFLGQSVLIADFSGDGLPDILHTALIDDSDDPPPPPFNGVRVLVNQRNDVNRPPVVSAPDRTWNAQDLLGSGCPWVRADVIDPDQHAVTFDWRESGGTIVYSSSVYNSSTAYLCGVQPGSYHLEVTIRDGRGAVVTQSVTLTFVAASEIVLYAADDRGGWMTGNWSRVSDPTAAGGLRAYDRNLGAAKVTAPSSLPGNLLVLQFAPDPTLTYKLWIRMKADKDNWANDSVWVQFSGSTDVVGTPVDRFGWNTGLAVSLEECVNCGVKGWGWQDDGWGTVNKAGVLLRFPESQPYTTESIYIQSREDGVSIDQVVLSAEKYLTARPGASKNDTTILKQTYPIRENLPSPR